MGPVVLETHADASVPCATREAWGGAAAWTEPDPQPAPGAGVGGGLLAAGVAGAGTGLPPAPLTLPLGSSQGKSPRSTGEKNDVNTLPSLALPLAKVAPGGCTFLSAVRRVRPGERGGHREPAPGTRAGVSAQQRLQTLARAASPARTCFSRVNSFRALWRASQAAKRSQAQARACQRPPLCPPE